MVCGYVLLMDGGQSKDAHEMFKRLECATSQPVTFNVSKEEYLPFINPRAAKVGERDEGGARVMSRAALKGMTLDQQLRMLLKTSYVVLLLRSIRLLTFSVAHVLPFSRLKELATASRSDDALVVSLENVAFLVQGTACFGCTLMTK